MKIFSNGGGVDSIAALVLSARGEIDYPLHVFANVGDDSEHPETLAYLHEHAIPYAHGNGIEFKVEQKRRRGGGVETLYQATLRRLRSMVLPVWWHGGGPMRRSCTTEFKIRVVSRYGMARGVGITVDEWQRVRTNGGAEYPLVDLRLTRADCVGIIRDAGLPIPPKSACWFCPFQRVSRWKELRDNYPSLFEKACDIERILSERSKSFGRDERYLSSAGAQRQAVLADVVGTDIQMAIDRDSTGCSPWACASGT